ncbi:MAG TPA: class I SAM-dependent methyltransferase [Acetobacteraceae bacterium]|nr:class I SAM-dependent methyltransferase [Acetobacteraceae bacterium]
MKSNTGEAAAEPMPGPSQAPMAPPASSPPASSYANDVINMWRTEDSKNYRYYSGVEDKAHIMWAHQSRFRQCFDELDLEAVVEIACGQGRHTAFAAPLCGTVWATDTSVDAIAVCKERFKDVPNVNISLVAGDSALPMIEDASITAVFSYDAMVHFELLTIASYMAELSRILRPGGRALLHHSNYGDNPTGKFTANPGWRNFMTFDIMRYLASRNDMKVVKHISFGRKKVPDLDALTTFQRI